jgi:hypothetical protein
MARRRFAGMYWLILGLAAVAWLAVCLIGAPRYPGVDVFVYKDAGCNLALGHGFTAHGLPGTPDFEPHLFASSGPGGPFTFGLAAMAFGCSGYTSTLYNLLCGVLGAFGVAYLLLPLLPAAYRIIAAVLIALALPSGLVFTEPDRPGVPAFPVFVAACLLARSRRPVRQAAAALMAGLCAVFFPFGGILAGLAVWMIVVTVDSHRPLIGSAIGLFLIFLAPLVAVAGVYGWYDPSFGDRFLGNAFGPGSGVGNIVHNSYAALLRHAATSAGIYSTSLVASFVVIAALVLAWGALWRRDPVIQLTVAAFVLIPVMLFPSQSDYMAWARTALLVLIAAVATTRFVPTVALTLICLAIIPFEAIETLKQIQSRASYEIALGEAREFAGLIRDQKGVVIVPPPAYFLYKPLLPNIVDANYTGDRLPLDRLAGYAACYTPLRLGETPTVLPAYARVLRRVSEAGSRYVPTLFGRPVTHSQWGWSCDHYLGRGHAVEAATGLPASTAMTQSPSRPLR